MSSLSRCKPDFYDSHPLVPTDALIAPYEPPIRLQAFEGPLDLLLFLIRKNEIDIYDIPIEKVTDQYLDILHGMERMNLEIAGDFFVMAATLMLIKSRMLLPKDQQPELEDEGEEGTDPRWELVRQLIEYKKFKDAATDIAHLIDEAQNLLPRYFPNANFTQEERPLQPTDKIGIWNTFNQVLRRLAEKITIGQIHAETVTVADRMEFVLKRLETETHFTFTSLFQTGKPYGLVTVVATFLAILELTRLGNLTLRQDAQFGEIYCDKAEPRPVVPDTIPIEEDPTPAASSPELDLQDPEEDPLDE